MLVMSSLRQKKVASKLMENNGNVSKTMRESGYSKNYAKNPQTFLNSQSWQELVEQYLPDKKVAERLQKALDNENDNIALKAIDISLKVKGKYAATKFEVSDPMNELTDEELRAIALGKDIY